MSKLLVLLQIAVRNLFAGFLNVIIGGILLVGTALLVVGGSLIGSMDDAMSRSIIGSAAGHLQVYSDKSKDKVSIFGNFGGEADLAVIEDFKKLKQKLSSVGNVREVVPMGMGSALVTSGNTVDLTLAKLRDALRRKLAGDNSPELKAEIESQKAHVQQILKVLERDQETAKLIGTSQSVEKEDALALEKASTQAFWAGFNEDSLGSLEFLENRIAPQVIDADLLYIRYAGTDVDAFARSFDRLQVVDGKMIPKAHRGLLLSKFFYEDQLKLKSARRLDKIDEAIREKHKTIAGDPDLTRFVKENQQQTKEILLQLDRLQTQKMVQVLQEKLKAQETDLEPLLVRFFATDDANFADRYKFFYAQMAPMLELYRIRVGDMLTIKTFTKSGFMESVNVKVYGTFDFKGLEKSPVSGALSLMDLMSFRDLYGYLSTDKLQEMRALKAKGGVKEVSRETAESELFGSGTAEVANAATGKIDDTQQFDGQESRSVKSAELVDRQYTQEEIDSGIVLNAAVLLKDFSKLKSSQKEIEQLSAKDGLGLNVLPWDQAAGVLGNMVFFMKTALYVAVGIIFLVALIIINNAVMMATLQRVKEIGTMRAIGAHRTFVLGMVLLETIVLGVVFGGTGAAVGSGIVWAIGRRGIPAFTDQLYFFFSGPSLHPWVSAPVLIAAVVVIFVVSAVSTLYPAVIATRVAPVTAMQTEE